MNSEFLKYLIGANFMLNLFVFPLLKFVWNSNNRLTRIEATLKHFCLEKGKKSNGIY